MKFPICEIDEAYHRLIPSRSPPVPLYERLGTLEIQKAAEALELLTNPRVQAMARMPKAPVTATSANRSQNWNLAPFAYPTPEGTTFCNPAYKVLDLVKGVRPALAIAVQRREAFLSSTSEPAISLEMRVIMHPVKGKFADLTALKFEDDQARRWAIGAEIYESDAQGIVYHRPELPGVRAVTVFDGGVLGRAVQSEHYRFVWDGERVTTIGNFSSGAVISRDQLFNEFGGRAAA